MLLKPSLLPLFRFLAMGRKKVKPSLPAWHGFFLPLFFYAPAYAGAWTQLPGDLQVINSFSYYRSNDRFDNSGDRQNQVHYRKWEWNPYAEYGFDQDTTFGASLWIDKAESSGKSDLALAESEWFVRRALLQQGALALAVQPKIKLPGFSNADAPLIGSRHTDMALAVPMGYRFSYLGRSHYAELEPEYRYRFGMPRNQYRLNATLGLSVTDTVTVMPQAYITWRADNARSVTFTQSTRDDYTLATLQLSALVALTSAQSLQLGVFSDVGGKNAGAGEGIRLALWSRF